MNNQKVKEALLQLITDNFGESMAKMYDTFYTNQDIDVVVTSVKELLTELLGKEKAEEQIQQVYDQFHPQPQV